MAIWERWVGRPGQQGERATSAQLSDEQATTEFRSINDAVAYISEVLNARSRVAVYHPDIVMIDDETAPEANPFGLPVGAFMPTNFTPEEMKSLPLHHAHTAILAHAIIGGDPELDGQVILTTVIDKLTPHGTAILQVGFDDPEETFGKSA